MTTPTGGDFRAALFAHLKACTAIVAIVGEDLYPNRLPQTAEDEGTKLGFRIESFQVDQDLDGPTGTATAKVQVEARGPDLDQVQAAADAVRAALLPVCTGGRLGSGTERIRVQWGAHDGQLDEDPEEPTDGSDAAAFRVIEVFRFEALR